MPVRDLEACPVKPGLVLCRPLSKLHARPYNPTFRDLVLVSVLVWHRAGPA